MKVYLCVWHVKRTWLKNLKQKVAGKKNWGAQTAILAEITAILEDLDLASAQIKMDAFLKKWVRTHNGPDHPPSATHL